MAVKRLVRGSAAKRLERDVQQQKARQWEEAVDQAVPRPGVVNRAFVPMPESLAVQLLSRTRAEHVRRGVEVALGWLLEEEKGEEEEQEEEEEE